MKSIIKLISLFVLITFSSCSDESNYSSLTTADLDSELIQTRENLCPYNITLVSSSLGDDGEPCETLVEFVFISETGEEIIYSYNPADGPPPTIFLPPGETFALHIRSQGGQSSCGDFEWRLSYDEASKCIPVYSHYVDSRPDLIVNGEPDYLVIIPEDCSCPGPDPDPEPEICHCRCTIERPDGSQESWEYVIDCDKPEECGNQAFGGDCEIILK